VNKFLKLSVTVIIGLTLLLLSGCSSAPPITDAEWKDYGQKVETQLVEHFGQYENKSLESYIQTIANTTKPAITTENIKVVVLDSLEVFTLALPNNTICLTRGLLGFINSDSALAFLLTRGMYQIQAKYYLNDIRNIDNKLLLSAIKDIHLKRADEHKMHYNPIFPFNTKGGGIISNWLNVPEKVLDYFPIHRLLFQEYPSELKYDQKAIDTIIQYGYSPHNVISDLNLLLAVQPVLPEYFTYFPLVFYQLRDRLEELKKIANTVPANSSKEDLYISNIQGIYFANNPKKGSQHNDYYLNDYYKYKLYDIKSKFKLNGSHRGITHVKENFVKDSEFYIVFAKPKQGFSSLNDFEQQTMREFNTQTDKNFVYQPKQKVKVNDQEANEYYQQEGFLQGDAYHFVAIDWKDYYLCFIYLHDLDMLVDYNWRLNEFLKKFKAITAEDQQLINQQTLTIQAATTTNIEQVATQYYGGPTYNQAIKAINQSADVQTKMLKLPPVLIFEGSK